MLIFSLGAKLAAEDKGESDGDLDMDPDRYLDAELDGDVEVDDDGLAYDDGTAIEGEEDGEEVGGGRLEADDDK